MPTASTEGCSEEPQAPGGERRGVLPGSFAFSLPAPVDGANRLRLPGRRDILYVHDLTDCSHGATADALALQAHVAGADAARYLWT